MHTCMRIQVLGIVQRAFLQEIFFLPLFCSATLSHPSSENNYLVLKRLLQLQKNTVKNCKMRKL
jgi:hypothetical protein